MQTLGRLSWLVWWRRGILFWALVPGGKANPHTDMRTTQEGIAVTTVLRGRGAGRCFQSGTGRASHSQPLGPPASNHTAPRLAHHRAPRSSHLNQRRVNLCALQHTAAGANTPQGIHRIEAPDKGHTERFRVQAPKPVSYIRSGGAALFTGPHHHPDTNRHRNCPDQPSRQSFRVPNRRWACPYLPLAPQPAIPYTPPVAETLPRKNHETPRLTAPVAGGHIRQKEKRHETE